IPGMCLLPSHAGFPSEAGLLTKRSRATLQPYHLTHHKSLGVDGLDTDLPTAFEAIVLDSILGKAFFCTFQIFFYALRPMFVYRVEFTWIHWLNIAVQLAFDYTIYQTMGLNSLL